MWSAVSPAVTVLIAGAVSLIVTILTNRSTMVTTMLTNRSTSQSATAQALQAQFKEILAKRIDNYPKLWRIHIHYETNWTLEGKPKTREWAQEYIHSLNDLNLECGLFFSQDLYVKFAKLRTALYEAINRTEPGDVIPTPDILAIRHIVYGGGGEAGLSAVLKDDLGSYRSALLQRRAEGP
jgi:hypothetical protein